MYLTILRYRTVKDVDAVVTDYSFKVITLQEYARPYFGGYKEQW